MPRWETPAGLFMRFTIRDLFWLTVLVATVLAMALAWRADSEKHRQAETSLRKAIHEIRAELVSQIKKAGRSPWDVKREKAAMEKAAADSN